ncbi:MAG TPA: M20/M25/M40 family metallo-hydrolase, partial [Exilispira sp.]|nr:M20/M25/M40 family metallo-hydrolase [Exilispira sp.]
MQNQEEKYKSFKIELIFDQLVIYRRSLHKIPEPSLNEVKTAQYIKCTLEGLNIPHKSIARTGVVAFIEGMEDYTIAFRADMDGLPLEEKTGLDFCSTNSGYMHACGHDMHMAILL